jgi:hypothetical protein
MAAKTLAERMKLLEESNKVLKKQVQVLEDTRQIANLMGRYIYLHEVQRDPEFPDTMYAIKTPGVSAEVAHFGAYVGEAEVRRLYTPSPGADDMKKGTLFTHPLTTPVIEVAGDGKTAKGIWMSPGYETGKDPKTGKLNACWAYTKYGCDFAKEGGKWKVWHYHVYRMFMTPFNVPWTEEWEAKQPPMEGPTPRPTKPTTYDHPYSTTTERELVPAPPEPYETFSETFSYGVPD